MTPGNLLHHFVGAFIEELVRSGVAHVCLCPGSRSTPLALLLRKHPGIKVWTHLDERSAAFFALGMAKMSQQPVALVATSGTATVNFAPAVVEAYYARVPLLVLTADRPPELRGVGALQTIDQVRLYGSHVKWFTEMALPEGSDEAVRYARTVACRAASIARAEAAGPVHINFPFREPLIPIADGAIPAGRSGPDWGSNDQRPYVAVTQALRRPDPADLVALATELRAGRRGLIVCGPQNDPTFPAVVARLAEELNFPLLADALSQVRCGEHHNGWIVDSYDAFLRSDRIARDVAPEIILRFGATPVSKPLLLYLQRHPDCRHIVIDESENWRDPAAIVSDVIHAQPRAWCEALLAALQPLPRPSSQEIWSAGWTVVGQRSRAAMQETLTQTGDLSEPRIFVELADLLPAGATLFAGNSMPVRDLETVFAGSPKPIRFLANRGASGIDGVVSTALGVAAVSADPLVLVIGDLSFYHDMNGLLAAKQHHLHAIIILLNNDGGGIFSFLPQADHAESREHFEELFGTPHGLDFCPAAELYGLTYKRPADWEGFRSAVTQALDAPGVTLLEVRTERGANVALHRKLWEMVSLLKA